MFILEAAVAVVVLEAIARIPTQVVLEQQIRVMQAVAEVLLHGLPLTRAAVVVAPEQ
jgi:hypothetical protein